MTRHGLPRHLFFEPAHATKAFQTLCEAFIRAGTRHDLEQFITAVRPHLMRSPDPDLAVTNLLRFTEATLSKAALFNDLIRHPVLMELLVKVFGDSRYFADILVRDPELFRWLTASDMLMRPIPAREFSAETERAVGTFTSREKKLDALRRLYRRQVLRIGTRDILGNADLETTTLELSNLADVLIDQVVRLAREELEGGMAVLPALRFAVVGLGKLGGRELNYSSDVDLLFVYDVEGEVKVGKGKPISHHEYANRVAERIVQYLSQSSAEGHLYRVDTRLRPEGGVAPLTRSIHSYLSYYESRGELWERQMLIKARPVGGDRVLGEEFIRQLDPFVYPRTFFHHPAEAIRRTKGRIEGSLGETENVKLRAGGIRDIEFVVQLLQLLNGGRNRKVRTTNTLAAIRVLAEERLLSAEESDTLTGAYLFFRTLEHRLQTMLNTQTHTLPGGDRSGIATARRMGFESYPELRRSYDLHLERVKGVFDAVFAVREVPGRAGTDIDALLETVTEEQQSTEVLHSYGLRDPGQAVRNLRFLLSGSTLTGARDLDSRVRSAFRDVARSVFEDVAATPSPDMTLGNLVIVAGGQRFPEQFYHQLRDSGFRNLVLAVCARSPRCAKGLARDPLILEKLAADPAAVPDFATGVPKGQDLIMWKRQQELHVAVRNLLGLTSFGEMTGELSNLAEAVLSHVFDAESRARKMQKAPLAFLALGKLGTREISFDADLDLLCVSGTEGRVRKDRMEKLASAVVQKMTFHSPEGRLYDMDLRLRPEGKNAPLVVDREAYLAYLSTRASLWERQSLTRLRFVCGDRRLGAWLQKRVEKFVYDEPLPSGWVGHIVAMRRKTESRSRVSMQGFLDFKLGAGGMVDVEFLAQAIQLAAGRREKEFRSGSTREVLQKAAGKSLTAGESAALISAYDLYREVEKLARLTLEVTSGVLAEGEKLELVARCLDGSSGHALYTRLDTFLKETRQIFLAASRRLASS